MTRTVSADFTLDKNKEKIEPVWLYRIAVTSDPSADLYFAEYDIDVAYFKDADTPQVYTAFPIKHAGISESMGGAIDTIRVSVGNLDKMDDPGYRYIQAYLENYEGLINKQVTIRLVLATLLDDPYAYVEFKTFIDTTSLNAKVVTFTLKSGLDLLRISCPRYRYLRDHCQWIYKDRGCWLWNGSAYVAPAGFLAGDPDTCDRTIEDCERHINNSRPRMFPGVPSVRYTR